MVLLNGYLIQFVILGSIDINLNDASGSKVRDWNRVFTTKVHMSSLDIALIFIQSSDLCIQSIDYPLSIAELN